MVNKVKIQIMIDTFKRLYKAPLPEHPDKGFNMEGVHFKTRQFTQHNCGTAACIYGWSEVIFGTSLYDFAEKLEISPEEEDALTCPERPSCEFDFQLTPEKFTLPAAIRVLQILRLSLIHI